MRRKEEKKVHTKAFEEEAESNYITQIKCSNRFLREKTLDEREWLAAVFDRAESDSKRTAKAKGELKASESRSFGEVKEKHKKKKGGKRSEKAFGEWKHIAHLRLWIETNKGGSNTRAKWNKHEVDEYSFGIKWSCGKFLQLLFARVCDLLF